MKNLVRVAAQHICNDVRQPRRKKCVSILLLLAAGVSQPSSLHSQDGYSSTNPGSFLGFAIGTSFQGFTGGQDILHFGGTLNAFFGVRPSRYFAVRTEFGGVAFPNTSIGLSNAPCDSLSRLCVFDDTGLLDVWFVGETILLSRWGVPVGPAGHFSFGVAAYTTNHPSLITHHSIGWNLGAVFETSQKEVRKQLEIRFHRIPGAGSNGSSLWVLPISLGISVF